MEEEIPEKRKILMQEASTGISLVSVLAAGVFFVLSLLLTRFDQAIFSSIIFLFVSVFGNIYSALIYANATGQLSRLGGVEKAERTLEVGNVISEFFGVYPIVFAFPVAFLFFTNIYTSVIILIIDLAGFVFYHTPGEVPGSYSILERYSAESVYIVMTVFSSLIVFNFIVNAYYSQNLLLVIFSTLLLILGTGVLSAICLLREEK